MWNSSLIDGPIPVPLYGPEQVQEHGTTIRPITGYREGYHLNVAPQVMTQALQLFAITPKTPDRAFAGAETVFLRFASEAEAKTYLPDYWIEEES